MNYNFLILIPLLFSISVAGQSEFMEKYSLERLEERIDSLSSQLEKLKQEGVLYKDQRLLLAELKENEEIRPFAEEVCRLERIENEYILNNSESFFEEVVSVRDAIIDREKKALDLGLAIEIMNHFLEGKVVRINVEYKGRFTIPVLINGDLEDYTYYQFSSQKNNYWLTMDSSMNDEQMRKLIKLEVGELALIEGEASDGNNTAPRKVYNVANWTIETK